MSNIADLKTHLQTKAADLTDDLDKLECLSDIDTWYLARTAIDALSSTDVTSYSIGGRSVTRAQIPQLQQQERTLYLRIMQRLYLGGMGLIDLSNATDGTLVRM